MAATPVPHIGSNSVCLAPCGSEAAHPAGRSPLQATEPLSCPLGAISSSDPSKRAKHWPAWSLPFRPMNCPSISVLLASIPRFWPEKLWRARSPSSGCLSWPQRRRRARASPLCPALLCTPHQYCIHPQRQRDPPRAAHHCSGRLAQKPARHPRGSWREAQGLPSASEGSAALSEVLRSAGN